MITENPANKLGRTWDFLKDGHIPADYDGLKDEVYTLIGMTTQKSAGQRMDKPADIPWHLLEMTKYLIICHATALDLNGDIDRLKAMKEGRRNEAEP